jgi:patatin-like phospholipase/acyl hydrolase
MKAQNGSADTPKSMRILSIDGGGIRGVLAVSVLVEVERIIQDRMGPDARLADCFDLVAGTSAGGLIGGLLLIPERAADGIVRPDARPAMSAQDVLDFYLEFGPGLFRLTPVERVKRLGGLVDERYSSAGFNAALDSRLGTSGPELMLSQLLRPTIISTYNASTGAPYFFKQHRATGPGGRDFSLRDVALATSAAPTAFETVAVRSSLDDLGACVDGGLFANNPTMCGYAEAAGCFGHSAKDMAILSIGTGVARQTYEYSKMRNWGALSWMGPIFEMMIAGSSSVVDYQVRQIFETLGGDVADRQYLRLQADLSHESRSTKKMNNARRANLDRLADLGRELVHRQRPELERFVDSQLLGRPVEQHAPAVKVVADDHAEATPVTPRTGPEPSRLDHLKIRSLAWMRRRNQETVDSGEVDDFRRRRMPTSGMPTLVPACSKHPHMWWVPQELMVADEIPPEVRLPLGYKLRYYLFAKSGFKLYNKMPLQPDVPWRPDFEWNREFPPTRDGWQHPTADETFARLRLQGPNPWLLRQTADGDRPTFEVDYSPYFEGVLPPIVARFAVDGEEFVATDITVGPHTHRPGDPTWAQAKRVANAADARYVAMGRHFLETHLIVGQAFALAAFSLPTWHDLRPFMQFFTYATLDVNSIAYSALVTEGSYFVESGFISTEAARHLFEGALARFDMEQWTDPIADIERRGLANIPDHPYVADAQTVWPAFVNVVERHLDDLGLDDAAIRADKDLQGWYLTLLKILPNEDWEGALQRPRLVALCAALLWNNVIHEVAGDLSPLLGSEDPLDKATVNLSKLSAAIADGDLTTPIEPPTMAEVFLADQASFVSRFNVGGNNILAVNAARVVDDPKLREAIEALQETLSALQNELVDRNADRVVRFHRMLPRHWEASISY